MLDLYELFIRIPRPLPTDPEARVFSAAAPWGGAAFRLARSIEDYPYFMIPATGRFPSAGVRLEHLSVEPRVTCLITEPDGSTTKGDYTLIGCGSSEPELQAFFLRIIAMFVRSFDSATTEVTIGRGIDLLLTLFRALKQPAKKSVRGLWAELFLISESSGPLSMLDAWHADPQELYDFNSGSDRLEVKSSADRREHHFRREQLLPPAGCRLLVASIIVKTAGAGVSVADLVGRIASFQGIDGARLEKLSRVTGETLGQEWRSGVELRFDEQWAHRSLEFYDGSRIPGLREPIPPEVSNVHFIVNMSGQPAIQHDQWKSVEILRVAAPRSARNPPSPPP